MRSADAQPSTSCGLAALIWSSQPRGVVDGPLHLRSAGQHAASQAAPWVELARHAGADEGAERIVVRFILENEDAESVSKGDTSLRDRLSRLENFANLAQSVAAELRAQLGSDDAQEHI
jgi:hypothetical protein